MRVRVCASVEWCGVQSAVGVQVLATVRSVPKSGFGFNSVFHHHHNVQGRSLKYSERPFSLENQQVTVHGCLELSNRI